MRQQGKKSAAQVVGVALTGNIAAEPLVAQVRSERGGVVVEGVFVCVCVCVCIPAGDTYMRFILLPPP